MIQDYQNYQKSKMIKHITKKLNRQQSSHIISDDDYQEMLQYLISSSTLDEQHLMKF